MLSILSILNSKNAISCVFRAFFVCFVEELTIIIEELTILANYRQIKKSAPARLPHAFTWWVLTPRVAPTALFFGLKNVFKQTRT